MTVHFFLLLFFFFSSFIPLVLPIAVSGDEFSFPELYEDAWWDDKVRGGIREKSI